MERLRAVLVAGVWWSCASTQEGAIAPASSPTPETMSCPGPNTSDVGVKYNT
jgi:hypothetical protein